MAYSQLDASNANGNLNTGNISTDDFLAIFSTITTSVNANDTITKALYAGKGGGDFSSNNISSSINNSNNNNNVTLNPPLLKVDGQYTLTNVLESSLAGVVTTLNPNYINDSFFYWNGNFFNNSVSGGGSGGSGSGTTSTSNTSGSGGSPGQFNYNQTLLAANNSSSNVTEFYWDGRYPSGYTLTQIVITSIIVTILMIIIVVGNMLVIIAIATEKSLKNIQNWFIASLAVADFFLGLVIMPFSLANELMGYWVFGSWWCDIHSAMDVLLCTASIMNLCLISLDRYWSITKAVDYLKSRTPARAVVMIAAVWIMSALICIPPLLGWKVKLPEGPLPKCALSEDIGYVLYSALGSFYIPSCIMVFVYIRIYFAAKARARRGIKKHPRKTNNEQVTSFTTTGNKGTIPMPSSSAGGKIKQIATIETPPNSATLPIQIPTVTCDLASDISTSEAADIEPHPIMLHNGNSGLLATNTATASTLQPQQHQQLQISSSMPNAGGDVLKVSTITTARGTLTVPTPPSIAADIDESLTPNATTPLTTSNELRVSPVVNRGRALSVGIDTDMVSEFDPSSSDSGVVSRCAVVKPLKFRLCQPIFGRKAQQQRQNEEKAAAAAAAAALQQMNKQTQQQQQLQQKQIVESELLAKQAERDAAAVIAKVQKPRDPEKEKRRIARKKEKRATLILGLIMGSFIACWLPFFFLYILMPACRSHCSIPDSAFAVAFWLGYMNSALNPAIYTIFNKDFRRAFRRILFK